MKAKVYAVAIGRTVGLFDSWAGPGGAQQATSGFPGAKFKAFKTPADASSYLREFGVAPCAGAGAAASSPSVSSPSASKYFQPSGRATADPAPRPSSPAGHCGASAASDTPANSADELDGLDDSFLEDVDIDAIVRRHSASDAPKRRPLSPSATAGPSDKRQRRSAPAAAHQQIASAAGAAARPQTRSYPFHQPDAEVERRIGAIPEAIRAGLMPHQYGLSLRRCVCVCVCVCV